MKAIKFVITTLILSSYGIAVSAFEQIDGFFYIKDKKDFELYLKEEMNIAPEILNEEQKDLLLKSLQNKGLIKEKEQAQSTDTTGWKTTSF